MAKQKHPGGVALVRAIVPELESYFGFYGEYPQKIGLSDLGYNAVVQNAAPVLRIEDRRRGVGVDIPFVVNPLLRDPNHRVFFDGKHCREP